MKKVFRDLREFFKKIPLKTYVTIFLEGIGLFANIIAIVTFFSARNTPETSPNFYINNQEFLAWSTLAVIYTTGIVLARMKRRWQRLYNAQQIAKRDLLSTILIHNDDNWEMFKRDFAFTMVISFPLTFLYVRAIQVSFSAGTISPWASLFTTVLISVPITFLGMLVSGIFYNALALYSGE